MLTTKKHKLVVSAKVTYHQAKRLITFQDEDLKNIFNEMKYSEILHYDEHIIVWERGYTLDIEDIIYAYLADNFLFIEMPNWMMVFIVD